MTVYIVCIRYKPSFLLLEFHGGEIRFFLPSLGMVLSTSDGETLETTAEHPFYELESALWLAVGQTEGRWTDALDLKAGDRVWQADGTSGVVQVVEVVPTQQRMYNLTVDKAHTFYVGQGQWLVHNCGGIGKPSDFVLSHGLSGDSATKRVLRLADEMKANGFNNLDSIKIIEYNGQKIVVDGHHRLAAARLAKVDVPYQVVDETWIQANTSWKSLSEIVESTGQTNSVRLNPYMVKKAGYK